jgi:hypothetical protein
MNWPSFLLGVLFTFACQGAAFCAAVAWYTFKAMRERQR